MTLSAQTKQDTLLGQMIVTQGLATKEEVEDCVAKTIKRIVFPSPKGGGIVVVTYPFIFKPEGS